MEFVKRKKRFCKLIDKIIKSYPKFLVIIDNQRFLKNIQGIVQSNGTGIDGKIKRNLLIKVKNS